MGVSSVHQLNADIYCGSIALKQQCSVKKVTMISLCSQEEMLKHVKGLYKGRDNVLLFPRL